MQNPRPNTIICFCNTGKEAPETLQFLHDQEVNWGYKIHWLEFDLENKFREVTFETADRTGRPFSELLSKRKFLPNSVMRFCTQELKVLLIKRFLKSQKVKHWTNIVGIRYDEGHRANQPLKAPWVNEFPLVENKITKQDVMDFWSKQPFDLSLKSYQGNCDMCFLKGSKKLIQLIRENPKAADWWINEEQLRGATFRNGLSFTQLKDYALRQQVMFKEEELSDESINCVCTD